MIASRETDGVCCPIVGIRPLTDESVYPNSRRTNLRIGFVGVAACESQAWRLDSLS